MPGLKLILKIKVHLLKSVHQLILWSLIFGLLENWELKNQLVIFVGTNIFIIFKTLNITFYTSESLQEAKEKVVKAQVTSELSSTADDKETPKRKKLSRVSKKILSVPTYINSG